MPESTQERYNRLKRESQEAWKQLQKELHPPIGPDTEVWITHALTVSKKMTIKDLALQIRVPVSDLIKDGSIKDAGATVEQNSEWLHDESLEYWDAESDVWTVTEVR